MRIKTDIDIALYVSISAYTATWSWAEELVCAGTIAGLVCLVVVRFSPITMSLYEFRLCSLALLWDFSGRLTVVLSRFHSACSDWDGGLAGRQEWFPGPPRHQLVLSRQLAVSADSSNNNHHEVSYILDLVENRKYGMSLQFHAKKDIKSL